MQWADVIYIHSLGLPLFGDRRRAPRVVKIVGDLAWERAVRRGWIAPTEDIDAFQTKSYDPRVTLDRDPPRPRSARDGRRDRAERISQADGGRLGRRRGEGAGDLQRAAAGYGRAAARRRRKRGRGSALPDAPTVLTVGRLLPWKGVDHLIAALRRVPDVRLIVAGDGEILDALKAQAADLGDRVLFLGRVSREQMPLYMKAADYVALYSGYEGLSHTLLESLRVGHAGDRQRQRRQP